ncbi:MAG: hypothetical protein AAGA48_07570 [Myxococcota bacterium]
MAWMPPECVQVRNLLADYAGRWWFAGGWAVDLHLGRQTRDHHDVEVAIPRAEQEDFRSYVEGHPDVVRCERQENGVFLPWPVGHRIEHPLHQVRLHLREGTVLDALFNEVDRQIWRFRRDLRIRYSMVGGRDAGPLDAPLLLLFKARDRRKKDEADFVQLGPALTDEERAWFEDAVTVAYGPDHPWCRGTGFERVYSCPHWYDGPRSGVADFRGMPHVFVSMWEDIDREPETFRLRPLTPEAFQAAVEDWDGWLKQLAGEPIDERRKTELESTLGRLIPELETAAMEDDAPGSFRASLETAPCARDNGHANFLARWTVLDEPRG